MKRERIRLCGKARKMNICCLWILLILIITCLAFNRLRKKLEAERHTGTFMETTHLTAVSCGRPDYQGIRDIRKPMDLTITMVKSAVLFAKKPVHVHVFTEKDMVNMFKTEFQSWPAGIHSRVQFSLYEIEYEKYLTSEMAHQWKKWYKPCGSYRLLLPMILRNATTAAIYSDSDVIFVKSIDSLWAELKKFNKRQLVAISPTAGHPLGGSKHNENFISHPSGLFQINSGVMIMNYSRMLGSDWKIFHEEISKPTNERSLRMPYGVGLLLAYYKKFASTAEHDQKLLNIMFHFNPEMIKQLDCSWNFKNNFCQDNENVCSSAEMGDGAGAVHGITSAFFGDRNPTFQSLYEAFLNYDFEEDVETVLLNPLRKKLQKRAKDTYCGRKSHIIIRPLTESIRKLNKGFM